MFHNLVAEIITHASQSTHASWSRSFYILEVDRSTLLTSCFLEYAERLNHTAAVNKSLTHSVDKYVNKFGHIWSREIYV